MKIAIFSSWSPDISEANKKLAQEISVYLCKKGITVVTGGCSGIPAIVIENIHTCGGKTIGYFPVKDQVEHDARHHEGNIHSTNFYSELHFIPGFSARSLELIKHVDSAIILNGRIGTLSEFGMAVEEGLPLAVIEGTGGISDELKNITAIAKREFPNNEVVFEHDHKKAIDFLVENYKKIINVPDFQN